DRDQRMPLRRAPADVVPPSRDLGRARAHRDDRAHRVHQRRPRPPRQLRRPRGGAMNDRSPTEALHARAAELDAADPLARWRDEFHIADPDLAYLDGNSLGMPPRRTLDRVTAVMHDQWGRDLIRSWDHWVDLPRQVGDLLAPLIGARPGEVVVHD